MLLNSFSSPAVFLTVFCDLIPRSFFPGRSFFFWLLIAMGFYLAYLYGSSKNKKDFLKSPYILSVSVALVLFFTTYLGINIFLSDPPKEFVLKEKEEQKVLDILAKEQKLFEETELNFSNPLVHHKLISNHFEIPSLWKNEYGQVREREDFTLLNFYTDKFETLVDSHYLNNARFGLGLLHYHRNDLSEALLYFNGIKDQGFPMLDFYKAHVYLDLQDSLQAIASFKAASRMNDIFQKQSSQNLINLLYVRNDNEALFALLEQEVYKPYFSFTLSTKLYFLNNRIQEYYSNMISHVFRDFKWTGFFAAFVILIVWGMYVIRMDIFEKEHTLVLLIVLLSGMIFTLGCFYLYDYLEYEYGFIQQTNNLLLYCIFGIGLIEEFVKIIPLLLLLLIAPRVIREPYDYILYAAVSALGFSFMENLIYFDGNLNNVIHSRALTSVPGHIIDSSIAAYGFVLAKYRYKTTTSLLLIPVFFFLAMVNHGLYDYWLFADHGLMFVIGFLLSVSFWIIIINNSLNNSPSFNYRIVSPTHSIQLILSLSLLSILVLEYIMVAWENGPSYANGHFNGNLFFGGLMITYYASRLTSIDLVKGYWGGIPFKTINEKRADAEFGVKNFLIRLISGDTFTHSFINHEVILQAVPENEKLYSYFNTSVKGMITDRMVVTCQSAKGKVYEDPFWFRLETNTSIEVGGAREQLFFFRFEEARPSFSTSETLTIYLFVLKDKEDLHEKLSREKLRALGKAVVRR